MRNYLKVGLLPIVILDYANNSFYGKLFKRYIVLLIQKGKIGKLLVYNDFYYYIVIFL